MTDKHDRAAINLQRETQAAEALRAAMQALLSAETSDIEPDDKLIHDMIEGETSLHEMIEVAMSLITETEIMLVGLEDKMTALGGRKQRYTARKTMLRSMIEQAMVIGEIKKLELPDSTLSLSHRAGGVVIVDEMKLPADYWRKPDPEVDKAKVSAALKEGLEVPGATLGNGTVSLTVRRS